MWADGVSAIASPISMAEGEEVLFFNSLHGDDISVSPIPSGTTGSWDKEGALNSALVANDSHSSSKVPAVGSVSFEIVDLVVDSSKFGSPSELKKGLIGIESPISLKSTKMIEPHLGLQPRHQQMKHPPPKFTSNSHLSSHFQTPQSHPSSLSPLSFSRIPLFLTKTPPPSSPSPTSHSHISLSSLAIEALAAVPLTIAHLSVPRNPTSSPSPTNSTPLPQRLPSLTLTSHSSTVTITVTLSMSRHHPSPHLSICLPFLLLTLKITLTSANRCIQR